MSGIGGISSLEVVIERLEGRLDAIIGGFQVVVAVFGCPEAATQRVVSGVRLFGWSWWGFWA